ncbi:MULTISPECIES: hypothetical protein [unclassified Micromonospora]|uniref:hypothetical protein n=1 Tax=unclassified Micromonospora TaxID=2617518 RepID=UPI001C224CD3|nr:MULTISPECIES: hypothetical protein [unclassified Micromonospora]MBU8861639.1 hypothetical protein [Micromonospora sp. WMMB482]MDM4781208.1 hypothetical protein [Micromonospora sp. b486]
MRTRTRIVAAAATALTVLAGALLVPRWAGDTRDDGLTVTGSGYFFVGGQQVTDDSGGRTSTTWTGQAMVHRLVPAGADQPPVIMMPGLGLSSSIFLTTPDGREGWAQQAARAGHPVYVLDEPSLAVSGFDVRPFNAVAAGESPPESQPKMSVWTEEEIWPRWGFGESPGQPYPDTRFPVQDIDQFLAALPPYWRSDSGGRGPGATAQEQALLALLERTGPAILLAHSAAGSAAFAVADQHPEQVVAVVAVEPVGCPAEAGQVPTAPTIAVYGDRIAERRQTGRLDACRSTVGLVDAGGHPGRLVYLPDEGVRGNTHLMMQDDNSADIWHRIEDFLGGS